MRFSKRKKMTNIAITVRRFEIVEDVDGCVIWVLFDVWLEISGLSIVESMSESLTTVELAVFAALDFGLPCFFVLFDVVAFTFSLAAWSDDEIFWISAISIDFCNNNKSNAFRPSNSSVLN